MSHHRAEARQANPVAELSDLRIGQGASAPLVGRLGEQLQRLAPERDGPIDRARDPARNGLMSAQAHCQVSR